MKKKLILLSIASFVVGCSSSKSDYHYLAMEDDPQLEFSTDFGDETSLPVDFSLNIDNPEANYCSDFNDIGYYYPESSIFVLAKANLELSAKIPANKPVAIESHYNVGNQASCYAETKQFIAEKGKTYKVNFKLENKYCDLEIIDKETSQPVRVKIKNKCTK
ncbi:hypothetical protein GA0061081_101213 [Gilliamella bombicola]|uniref:Lipoprotein n=1 Tax=Gilliamella bombicola TaxID=1798182 RepID=A0A1C3Z1Y6_9GAMM|nr:MULTISPECIES: hypothetical protein [Gilliamella]NUF27575.1 hypothetical protein [Gilliamella sp. ESL0254]SCB76278.1 hypothetical protein GA0061081_101213 [Gilliamella bombicola]